MNDQSTMTLGNWLQMQNALKIDQHRFLQLPSWINSSTENNTKDGGNVCRRRDFNGQPLRRGGESGMVTMVSASDWCALQEALYKCIDTIQYNTLHYCTTL